MNNLNFRKSYTAFEYIEKNTFQKSGVYVVITQGIIFEKDSYT